MIKHFVKISKFEYDIQIINFSQIKFHENRTAKLELNFISEKMNNTKK